MAAADPYRKWKNVPRGVRCLLTRVKWMKWQISKSPKMNLKSCILNKDVILSSYKVPFHPVLALKYESRNTGKRRRKKAFNWSEQGCLAFCGICFDCEDPHDWRWELRPSSSSMIASPLCKWTPCFTLHLCHSGAIRVTLSYNESLQWALRTPCHLTLRPRKLPQLKQL